MAKIKLTMDDANGINVLKDGILISPKWYMPQNHALDKARPDSNNDRDNGNDKDYDDADSDGNQFFVDGWVRSFWGFVLSRQYVSFPGLFVTFNFSLELNLFDGFQSPNS
jgi:hypothetical protein